MICDNFMNILCERDNRIHRLYASWAKSKGINYNMLAVLCSVYKSEGCTQHRICDEWCLAKQTVNTTCKELVELGFLISVQGSKDKRETNIALSEKGRDFVIPIFEELTNIEKSVFEKMGSVKVKRLMELYMEYTELTETTFEKSMNNKESLK